MKFKKLVKSLHKSKRTLFAVLIDPDKFNPIVIRMAKGANVDCFLVGGSVLHKGSIDETVQKINEISSLPVILFPGDENQLTKQADGVFLPSLLSGRNPEYLIGKQILMAPKIKQLKLKHAPMAYLLLDGNSISSTQKVTKTQTLNTKQPQLISDTVLAAQQLGFELLYLEAGSGAKTSVPISIIQKIKKETELPIIVGGGIKSTKQAIAYINAKVNMIVVGNAFEKDLNLMNSIGDCFKPRINSKEQI